MVVVVVSGSECLRWKQLLRYLINPLLRLGAKRVECELMCVGHFRLNARRKATISCRLVSLAAAESLRHGHSIGSKMAAPSLLSPTADLIGRRAADKALGNKRINARTKPARLKDAAPQAAVSVQVNFLSSSFIYPSQRARTLSIAFSMADRFPSLEDFSEGTAATVPGSN